MKCYGVVKIRIKNLKPGDNFVFVELTKSGGKTYEKITLDFVASFNFFSTSIEKHVDSIKLSNNDFKLLKDVLKNRDCSDAIMECKGVFLYDDLTSESVLNETQLPPKDKFYSNLKQSGISDEDYKHALKEFEKAKCRNMQDYLEL